MQKIVLFSASDEVGISNLQKTMQSDVDISNSNSKMAKFVKMRLWGSIKTKKSTKTYNSLEKGDILLFYQNKKYIASAILEDKEDNKSFAKTIWGTKEHSETTWDYIVHVLPKNFFSCNVDNEDFNKLMDYKKKFKPTRTFNFFVPKEENLKKIETKYGSIVKALESIGFNFGNSTDSKYLLLRYNPPKKRNKKNREYWSDILGKEYHYGKIPNYTKLNPKSKTIWFYTENEQIFLWGHGTTSEIINLPKNEFIAKMSNFIKFDEKVPVNQTVTQKIKELPGWNNFNSINEINKEIYDQINSEMNKPYEEYAEEIKNNPFPLAIKIETIERILRHLSSGKHIVLVGAPGVGKTELARRIMKVLPQAKNPDNLQVATAEWTRMNIVGGNDLKGNFQPGIVTSSVKKQEWLVIDEFNRADINKAFGEMFLSIEDLKIRLRDNEKYEGQSIIVIPEKFRIICTMNDFDKNLLLTELSYGLITRFAFIDVEPNSEEEQESIKHQILNKSSNFIEEDYSNCNTQIISYFNTIKNIREKRMIGVRTSRDIIRYTVSTSTSKKSEDSWKFLDEAMCDYLLPQLDRLDRDTIEHVKKSVEDNMSELKDAKYDFIKKLNKMEDQLTRISNILGSDND